MDLTKTYPRSVHDKWQGVVQLGRTIDKAKATAHGNIGEYHYNCPMDQHVFEFLGIDHEKMLEVVKNAKSDSDIEAFTKPYIDKKSPQDIEQFNRDWTSSTPTGQSLETFNGMRKEIAPDRDDVTTWADLLDLDEKRNVPHRVLA